MAGQRLAGKRALISAAGQGIGRATALAMAAEGAHVFATDINADTLVTLASTNHKGIETFEMDVRSDQSVQSGVARAQPDILFNCAGYVHSGTILDATDADWEFGLDLNVRSMFRTIKAVLPGMLERGELNIDKSRNDHIRLTFHDSCNVARGSRMGDMPGGQFEIPRAVLRAVCNNYFDMDRDTIMESTVCCGGGGGLLTDELLDLRTKGASPRMKAMQQVTEDHGVTHLAAICAICKTQFAKVMPKFGYDMDSILSVHQLVSNAIILDGQETNNTSAAED